MRNNRRRVRNFVGELIGVQGDLQIWWTPQLPIVYIANPKSGCTTVKHSLKLAEASRFERTGEDYTRVDCPHTPDDCLRRDFLAPKACRERYVISCVRNPFSRALSGFLDKVTRPGTRLHPEMGHRHLDSFEEYLEALMQGNPRDTNPHFRAQHYNLDYPRIDYDAIFFLEDLSPLSEYIAHIAPEFSVERRSRHARGARDKLAKYYTDKSVDMVRELFARDFELFGYSDALEDAGAAPAAMIVDERLVPAPASKQPVPAGPRHARPGTVFETTLRYRRLVDLRII
jgi:Sulfotransferase family